MTAASRFSGLIFDDPKPPGTPMRAKSALVGTRFRGQGAVECILRMRPGDPVRLEREPDNEYDANAIACHYLSTHVGYIPKAVNPRIAELIDRGVEVRATVEKPPERQGRRATEPMLLLEWSET